MTKSFKVRQGLLEQRLLEAREKLERMHKAGKRKYHSGLPSALLLWRAFTSKSTLDHIRKCWTEDQILRWSAAAPSFKFSRGNAAKARQNVTSRPRSSLAASIESSQRLVTRKRALASAFSATLRVPLLAGCSRRRQNGGSLEDDMTDEDRAWIVQAPDKDVSWVIRLEIKVHAVSAPPCMALELTELCNSSSASLQASLCRFLSSLTTWARCALCSQVTQFAQLLQPLPPSTVLRKRQKHLGRVI